MADMHQSSPKLGRPPKPPEIRRNKRLVTFLIERDYEELHAMAARRNVSLSALANELVRRSLHEELSDERNDK